MHAPRRRRRIVNVAVAAAVTVLAAFASAMATGVPNRLVANHDTSTVYRFDAAGAWQRTYALGSAPRFMEVSPDNRYAVTTSSGSTANGVAIVDLATHQVFDHAVAGQALGNPVFTSDGRYAVFGQQTSTDVQFHRVDLNAPATAPESVTSAAYVNCGQPVLVMRQVGASDEILMACYRANTSTGLYNMVRFSGFDQPTFAMTPTTTAWVSPASVIAMDVSGTDAVMASGTGLQGLDLSDPNATYQTLYAPGSLTCWDVAINQAAAKAYAPCASVNGGGHVVQSPLATASPVINPLAVGAYNPWGIALTPDGLDVEVAITGYNFTGGTTLNTWTTASLGSATTGTAVTSSPAFASPSAIAYASVAAPPNAPIPGAVAAADGALTIAFTPGADNGSPITNYEYSLDGGSWTAFSPAVTAGPVTISGLVNGTTYSIRLRAVNAGGAGAASSAVEGTPTAPPSPSPPDPAAPTTASATEGGSSPAPAPAYVPTLTFASRTFASTQVRSVTLTTRVRVNGPGRVVQLGRNAGSSTAWTRARSRAHQGASAPVLCTARRTVPRSGTYRMTCTLGRATRVALTRRSLKVALTTVFIASDGQRVTRRTTVRVPRIPAPRLPVTG